MAVLKSKKQANEDAENKIKASKDNKASKDTSKADKQDEGVKAGSQPMAQGDANQPALNEQDTVNVPTQDITKPMDQQDDQMRQQNNGQMSQQSAYTNTDAGMDAPQAIGKEQIRKANKILDKYKQGKRNLESRIVQNEEWWKLRHWRQLQKKGEAKDPKPASGWLFNCIMSKHADCMDSYPEPNILPREAGDVEEASKLSSIIPVILEQNNFESVYSDIMWYKLKFGTGCYGVFWDKNKLNGLGDITIKKVDLLNLFWEPGIQDLQKSRNIFHVELIDNDILEEAYPQLKGKLRVGDSDIKKYIYDDTIDTSKKSMVVDWYYHTVKDGKTLLQYCKYCGDEVLYASENDTEVPTKPQAVPVYDQNGNIPMREDGTPAFGIEDVVTGEAVADKGWYDHGMYPFVFDVLFPEEGLPTGFGYIDVCKDAQTSIDVLGNAIEKNAMWQANPRWFVRGDSGLNEEEFADLTKPFVHTTANLGQDYIRQIDVSTMPSLTVDILNNKINELKETSGNRDVNNGGATSGVTAASAIAAMQEQSGKSSRDMINASYRSYSDVIEMVIELIRQFYDMPRQFRILGESGQQQFTSYTNEGIQPVDQGSAFGVDMGYRLPVFDIKVSAQKANPYSKVSQNEMALQFFSNGFFNPEMVDQAMACIEMMDFDGKDAVLQKISRNGTLYQKYMQAQQLLLQMSEVVDGLTANSQNPTNMAESMANNILGTTLNGTAAAGASSMASGNSALGGSVGENTITANARAQAQEATTPR